MALHRYNQPAPETPQNAVSLTVSGGATPSNASGWYYIGGYYSIVLTVSNGNSTSLNAYVYTSPDNGVTVDNISYAAINLGASQIKSVPITPGPLYIRITVTNADASNATSVTSKLSRRYRW